MAYFWTLPLLRSDAYALLDKAVPSLKYLRRVTELVECSTVLISVWSHCLCSMAHVTSSGQRVVSRDDASFAGQGIFCWVGCSLCWKTAVLGRGYSISLSLKKKRQVLSSPKMCSGHVLWVVTATKIWGLLLQWNRDYLKWYKLLKLPLLCLKRYIRGLDELVLADPSEPFMRFRPRSNPSSGLVFLVWNTVALKVHPDSSPPPLSSPSPLMHALSHTHTYTGALTRTHTCSHIYTSFSIQWCQLAKDLATWYLPCYIGWKWLHRATERI